MPEEIYLYILMRRLSQRDRFLVLVGAEEAVCLYILMRCFNQRDRFLVVVGAEEDPIRRSRIRIMKVDGEPLSVLMRLVTTSDSLVFICIVGILN